MKPRYITVGEMKQMLDNLNDNVYLCLEANGSEWAGAELFITDDVEDRYGKAYHETIWEYEY